MRSPLRRIDALAAKVDELQRRVNWLANELAVAPYTAEPLRTTDEHGRPAIGYAANTADASEDVYRNFEDLFRGPEDLVRERQRAYLPAIGSRQPVLDAGCGRGELLDLLREADVPARGVDTDAGMVRHSRAKGHEVVHSDVNAYLEAQPDESFGALFSAQVIEHLTYEQLLRFFELSRNKLAPGGVFIAETVNPHSMAAFKLFWLDPTHTQPIFPEVAVALCRLHAFFSACVTFPNGVGVLERDRVEQVVYAVIAERG
jgi:SAM-dependent methyltransferase